MSNNATSIPLQAQIIDFQYLVHFYTTGIIAMVVCTVTFQKGRKEVGFTQILMAKAISLFSY